MKFKSNRGLSFIIVTAIYLLATALGVWLYLLVPLAPWLKLLVADVGATVFVFLFSLLFQNASVYDPYWSVQPVVIVMALACGYGFTPFTVLLSAVVLFWGIRLTANWAYTFASLSAQDWRYTMLREKTGKAYPVVNFVGIHLVPTLVVYACILPALYAFQVGAQLNAGCVVFLLLSLLAVLLQGTSDIQMHRFRKRKQAGEISDPFIRVGFWKHARHPNYLAEILMWWGVGLSVICALPAQWYLLFGALANTCLFLFVSIPLAEGKQSKKEGYDEYRRETHALIPLPKHF